MLQFLVIVTTHTQGQIMSWFSIESSNGLVMTINPECDSNPAGFSFWDKVLKWWCPHIVLDEYEGKDGQLWRLDNDGLLHSKTGLVLDIPYSNKCAGVQVQGYGHIHSGANQKFSYNGCSIKSALNGFVLDVKGEVFEKGTPIIMWPSHGGENQTFKMCVKVHPTCSH